MLERHPASGRLGLTPLERALRERIQAEGPITVEAYMEACNTYYYATRDPLGAAGDFTTAPEISQLFGEIIGACLADCWQRAGSHPGTIFAELGPGRGTLAADALRVLRAAGFAGDVHLVETSPALKVRQAQAVPGARWHANIGELPDVPLLLVANEFLDALPVRQFVNGIERRVTATGGGLAFDRDGEIAETSPARDEAVVAIAGHLAQHGGAGILIDYGHALSAPGDTLQAVRRHGFAPVLREPGEQDLTAHVDFEAAGRAASQAGALTSGAVTQGQWLKQLGIDRRAERLIASNPDRRHDVEQAVDRLCGLDEMGELFKVMAIRQRGWPEPAGFGT